MNDEKVYYSEVVSDIPLPGSPVSLPTVDTSPAAGTTSTEITQPAVLPKFKPASEVISTALNTRSLKVLQQFLLTQSGGFQIGNFEEGNSGDIKITPNGITARDKAGTVTFVIDGDSGDAVFKGSIIAGSIVTGAIQVGNGSVIIDGENKRIIVNDGNTDRIIIGLIE